MKLWGGDDGSTEREREKQFRNKASQGYGEEKSGGKYLFNLLGLKRVFGGVTLARPPEDTETRKHGGDEEVAGRNVDLFLQGLFDDNNDKNRDSMNF